MSDDEIVHMCPRDGEELTPCCGVTPFELPLWGSRITLDESLVTCSGAAAGYTESDKP